MKKALAGIEIRVVHNGYMAIPADGGSSVHRNASINVFESFEALVNWLRENLQDPEE